MAILGSRFNRWDVAVVVALLPVVGGVGYIAVRACMELFQLSIAAVIQALMIITVGSGAFIGYVELIRWLVRKSGESHR
jgi:hypothetical protein